MSRAATLVPLLPNPLVYGTVDNAVAVAAVGGLPETNTLEAPTRNFFDAKVIAYCQKEGEFITNIEKKVDPYALARDEPDLKKAVAILWAARPRDMCIYGDRIEANLRKRKAEANPPNTCPPAEYALTSFKAPQRALDWCDNEARKEGRRDALIIIGKTQTGKSAWAVALQNLLGRAMYFQGGFSLAEWDASAKYIILDNVPWEDIPAKKPMLCSKGPTGMTDKYMHEVEVVCDKACIVLMNEEEAKKFDEDADDFYWRDNAVIIRTDQMWF